MGSERAGSGGHTAPAPAGRKSRYADSSGGDGLCETQRALERLRADGAHARIGIGSGRAAHCRGRAKIAQAERIPTRAKAVERAKAGAPKIPRAQDRSGVSGALSPPGKARESNPEKTPPACRKVDAIGRSN